MTETDRQCSVCGEPQYDRDTVWTCKNGHAGAPSQLQYTRDVLADRDPNVVTFRPPPPVPAIRAGRRIMLIGVSFALLCAIVGVWYSIGIGLAVVFLLWCVAGFEIRRRGLRTLESIKEVIRAQGACPDFAEASSALSRINGPKILEFDDSAGGNTAIPPGLHNMNDVIFQGAPTRQNFRTRVQVNIAPGAQLQGLRGVQGNINIVNQATSGPAPIQVAAGQTFTANLGPQAALSSNLIVGHQSSTVVVNVTTPGKKTP